MYPFTDIHTHHQATLKNGIAIRNYILVADREPIKFHEDEFFSAGIHPWHIPQQPNELLHHLTQLATHPSCQAIGEVGLDKNADTKLDIQQEVYIQQLEMACQQELPLIIHCVKAWDELIAIHKTLRPNTPCIIHGFRGKPQMAEQLIKAGFYLSFGFHFNEKSLSICPSNRLFLETDEETRPISELYQTVSNIRKCEIEQLKCQCFDNLRNLNKKLQVSLKGRTFVEL